MTEARRERANPATTRQQKLNLARNRSAYPSIRHTTDDHGSKTKMEITSQLRARNPDWPLFLFLFLVIKGVYFFSYLWVSGNTWYGQVVAIIRTLKTLCARNWTDGSWLFELGAYGGLLLLRCGLYGVGFCQKYVYTRKLHCIALGFFGISLLVFKSRYWWRF